MKLLMIDTETSGLDPKIDRVIENDRPSHPTIPRTIKYSDFRSRQKRWAARDSLL